MSIIVRIISSSRFSIRNTNKFKAYTLVESMKATLSYIFRQVHALNILGKNVFSHTLSCFFTSFLFFFATPLQFHSTPPHPTKHTIERYKDHRCLYCIHFILLLLLISIIPRTRTRSGSSSNTHKLLHNTTKNGKTQKES